jgi:hypothetical protein
MTCSRTKYGTPIVKIVETQYIWNEKGEQLGEGMNKTMHGLKEFILE